MAEQPETTSPDNPALPECSIGHYFDKNAKLVQKVAALVAVGAAISEVIAIYRRGKAKEKQNIWTPLLLMVVKYCYAFEFYCAGLRDFKIYTQEMKTVKKNILKEPFAYNFTYFSKAVAFILWGITFFMVMTVQIYCGLHCTDEYRDNMDLSIDWLYGVLAITIAFMGAFYYAVTKKGSFGIWKSLLCCSVFSVVIGVLLGLYCTNELHVDLRMDS